MIFYVIVVTCLLTLLMNEFMSIITDALKWMKFILVFETKFGIFYILIGM